MKTAELKALVTRFTDNPAHAMSIKAFLLWLGYAGYEIIEKEGQDGSKDST